MLLLYENCVIVLDFFLFLFVAFTLPNEIHPAQKNVVVGEIYFNHDLNEQLNQWTTLFNAQPLKLAYEADVCFDYAEFMSLAPTMLISTREEVGALLSLIALKNKFEKATLTLLHDDTGVATLRITLTAYWIFGKVRFKGRMIGKDRYRRAYFLENGEQWHEENHRRAVETVKAALADEGYLAATIMSDCTFIPETKTVIVTLTLLPGKRFTINTATMLVQGHRDAEDTEFFAKKIKKISSRLHRSVYSSLTIDEHIKFLENFCLQHGFFDAKITSKKELQYERQEVSLAITVHLSHKKIFDFFGNHFFTKQQLLDTITPFGQSIGFIPPSILGEELKLLYKKKGFFNVSFTWQEDDEQLFSLSTKDPGALSKK